MIVNEDHYINGSSTTPARTTSPSTDLDTPYVVVAARTLVDPKDPDDLERGAGCRTGSTDRRSASPLRHPTTTRQLRPHPHALLTLARDWTRSASFGAEQTSTRSTTSSARPPAGADFPTPKPPTSASAPDFRSAGTSCASPTYRSTGSGRSRSTTPTATSSPTCRRLQRQQHHRRS